MTTSKLDITSDDVEPVKPKNKFEWYWSPVYCLVWFLLFYVAVIPSFYSYPEHLLVRDESHHSDEFIGERAEMQLLGLNNIGVKLTGTVENEVYAVNYLLNEIDKIKTAARNDLYDIEVDVQYSSGKFMLWGMATSYHNVSNVIVKISPKNTQSQSYLLLNSHFDSEVGTTAAADDGVMVVIMLETLRVISRSERPLKNPIVFLLNGAEESNLLAAHGFITQHKWAANCKALINLDSAGSGGREILFQSGPNHPWLTKYYKKSVPHPYASTIAEELFQNSFIPSDSDFRIFRDFGGVPGLDMAHTLNGYVYHTSYDNFANLERGTYQTTGDNVLALTWALANAPELEHPEAYAEGHSVFYDFLGWFMVFYTESTGTTINCVVCISALIVIGISVFLMTNPVSADSPKQVYLRFLAIGGMQIVSVMIGTGLPLLTAVIKPALGSTLSWYSEEWLIFGYYFCPLFYALGLFPAIYIEITKKKTNMQLKDTIYCFMHAHCIILIFACLLMTGLAIRSAFLPMIAIFFYTISVVLVLLNDHFIKKDFFLPIHLVCQLLPYWFYTYLTFAFLKTFIPMQGRNGPASKPELLISGFCVIMAMHFAGFIIPPLHKFRKPKIFFSLVGCIAIVFSLITFTSVGFPYTKDVAAQRFYVLHTNRVIHDSTGFVVKNESGFYVQPVDMRTKTLDKTTLANASPKSWTDTECAAEVFCGLPLYNSRWLDWKNSARWVPAGLPNTIIPTELTLTSKEYVTDTKIRFSFKLHSADRAVIYIDPYPNTKVTDWSFDLTPLKENLNSPYFAYHVYSFDDTPFEFWFDIERNSATYEGPTLRLGIGAHFLYHRDTYTEEYRDFLKSFPDWSYATHWTALFESWIF